MLKFLITLIALLVGVVAPALAQTPPTNGAAAPANAAPRGIMRYDTNKDGYVDHAEWASGQQTRFRQLDANNDSKLSADELTRRPAGAQGILPADAENTRRSAFFIRMDTDKDGFVSKAEFMSQADRNFARCDLNKDGRTNSDECRQALRRTR